MEIGFINSGWEAESFGKGAFSALATRARPRPRCCDLPGDADAEAVDRLKPVNTS